MKKLLFFLLILYGNTYAQLKDCLDLDTVNIKQLSSIRLNHSELFFEITTDSIVDNYTINLPCKSWSIHHDTINCNNKTPFTFNHQGRFILTDAHINHGVCFCKSCSRAARITNNDTQRHYISAKNCQGFPKTTIANKIDKTKPDWLEKPITKGTSFNLSQLIFYPNKSKFMKSSFAELKHLLNLLKTQPTLHIEIQGYVNGPNQKNSPAFQKLSEKRAKAVYEYLEKNGINNKRMSHQGFGNTKMLYRKPVDENQMKKNRRVEILVK
jgi:outer membrane protein OmpA-like peptidoglycan-associated protein